MSILWRKAAAGPILLYDKVLTNVTLFPEAVLQSMASSQAAVCLGEKLCLRDDCRY